MNARRHPILGPGVLMVEEVIHNNFSSLSASQISAQFTSARLRELHRMGVRKLDFRLPFTSIVTQTDFTAASWNYTFKAGVSAKIAAIGAIMAEWLSMKGTSCVFVFAHTAGSTAYGKLAASAYNAAPLSGFAGYMDAVRAALGSVSDNPRIVWAPWVESFYTGVTAADNAGLHYKLFQVPGANAQPTFSRYTWLLPCWSWAGIENLDGSWHFHDGTRGYFAPNVITRCSMYHPFFLTHLQSETDYSAAAIDSIGPDYPFTEARRSAMATAVGGSWTGRIATDALAAVGKGKSYITSMLNKANEFERKTNVPVLIEECGFAWRDAWGSNGPQIAWFQDVYTAAKDLKLLNKIGWFSLGAISPSVVNFSLGATDQTNAFVSKSKGALRVVTGGKVNVSAGEVSAITSGENSGRMKWTPASLGSKLVAWFDFTQVQGSNGTAVSSVAARAGTGGLTATSSGGARPTISTSISGMGNARGLSFTTTQYLDVSGFNLATSGGVTLVAVAKTTPVETNNAQTYILDAGTGTRFILSNFYQTTPAKLVIANAGSSATGNITSYWGLASLNIARYHTTGAYVRVNGVQVSTASTGAATLTNLRIGANNGGTSGFGGSMTHVLVISGTLTTDEIERLEWWLASTSGITVTNKYTGSTSVNTSL